MFYTLLIGGFVPERRDGRITFGQFRAQAREAARRVAGHASHVGRQVWFKDRWENKWHRSLTICEYAFGWTERRAVACELSRPLVSWIGHESERRHPEIRMPIHRTSEWDYVDDELVQFIRDIVNAAGWTIVKEEETELARRLMAGVDD